MVRTDEEYMERALQLAQKGWGNTRPNPMVGVVLVKDNEIIGEGYHKFAGADHAEVMAINNATKNPKNARLYVNLEPCCHYGRTPPCTDLIIKTGVRDVIIGVRDPDSRVSGNGIKTLLKAKIRVKSGVLAEESLKLNEGYIHFKKMGKPFVILKVGQTLDGRMATAKGESKWITGNESREDVQYRRAGVDSILVGSGTVIADNPELIIHSKKRYKTHPHRIILDTRGIIPVDANVFQQKHESSKTYWVIGAHVSKTKIDKVKSLGVQIIEIKEKKGHIDLDTLLEVLGALGICSILVEGGSRIHGAFMDQGLVDKVLFYLTPKIMGGVRSISSIGGQGVQKITDLIKLKRTSISIHGQDVAWEGYL